jgi:hypothetical protein
MRATSVLTILLSSHLQEREHRTEHWKGDVFSELPALEYADLKKIFSIQTLRT